MMKTNCFFLPIFVKDGGMIIVHDWLMVMYMVYTDNVKLECQCLFFI